VTQPNAVAIREAVAGDLPAMEHAKREAGVAAWPHIFPAEILGQLGFPERWAAAVTSPGAREAALVGELDGTVVGFAILRPSADDDATGDRGELDGFYVAPTAWGLGVGRALLAAALDRLRSDGFSDATLWTAVDNHRPRGTYETGGWRLDGTSRHRQLFGTEFEEVRYRIRL
jgi:GNAT superfamily N-acetyltransferase